MPVQIGATNHDFSEPLGLLSDCHRRIEMFLGSLQRLAEYIDNPLPDEARTALESALRYFQEAAPKHTADEEQSLFPRLREVNHDETAKAISALDALEDDHKRADSLHAEVSALGLQCLDHGPLQILEVGRFRQAVRALASIYREHIRIEDDVVFPVARQALSEYQKLAIASEMVLRRNLVRNIG